MTLTADFLFLVRGLPATISISFISFAIGFLLGIALAFTRTYAPKPVITLANAYVKLFLGVPVLVFMLLIHFGLGGYLEIFRSAYISSIIALGLRSGAYQSQIFVAAINSIPRDQLLAARALGLTKIQILRHIILPQAFIVALPGLGSEIALLIKDSSYSFILGVLDLTKHADILRAAYREFVTPYILAALIYIALTFPIANYLDKLGSKLKDKYALR